MGSFIYFLPISSNKMCEATHIYKLFSAHVHILCASVYYISKVDLATRLTARLAKCGTFRDARNIWSLASVFKWNVLLEIYCLEGQSQTCSESSLYWIATSYILDCNSTISPLLLPRGGFPNIIWQSCCVRPPLKRTQNLRILHSLLQAEYTPLAYLYAPHFWTILNYLSEQ